MKFTDLAKPEAWQEFRNNGFLRISNIIDPKKVEDLRTEAYRVFRRHSLIDKRSYRTAGRTGFTPAGIEGMRPDNGRQFWDVHVDTKPEEMACSHSLELVRRMSHVVLELSVIMSGVFYYMDRGLGPIANGLHRVMVKGNHGLRALHYPIVTEPRENLLFQPHRDFSLATVFVGGAETGLQVERSQAWHTLENPLGDIVIIAGRMLRYWTGGIKNPKRISGTRHRVLHMPVERMSLSLFTEPESTSVLPNSDGITAGEYIRRFVAATRAPK